MSGDGRSFRFLGLLLGAWVAVRIFLLWPTIDSVPALVRAIASVRAVAAMPAPAVRSTIEVARAAGVGAPVFIDADIARPRTMLLARKPGASDGIALATAGTTQVASPETGAVRSAASLVPPPPAPWRGGRLAGSSWLILRAGGAGGGSAGFGPSLGASQAGVRMTYALDEDRRVAIAARLSGALGMRQREAAIGIDWRPTALPVHLVAERRIALDGGRGASAAGIIAGIDPAAIGAGFRLEAYGQAGVIVRDGAQGFADGAVRVARAVASLGGLRMDLGAGAWAGAQRGASRVDIGPSLGVAVPAGGRTIRLNMEWRERIAGNARPGSGPALSVGTDF